MSLRQHLATLTPETTRIPPGHAQIPGPRDARMARLAVCPPRGERRVERHLPSPLHFSLDQRGELLQPTELHGRELVRLGVNEAQGADRLSLGDAERHASIEAETEVAGDEGVVGKPRVLGSIRDHHRLGLQDGVGAETDVARRIEDIERAEVSEGVSFVGGNRCELHGVLPFPGDRLARCGRAGMAYEAMHTLLCHSAARKTAPGATGRNAR
jgi:hypothetical protein